MPSESNLWPTWRDAARRPEVDRLLRDLLDEINREVAGSGFTCQQSGRCCRFESFGHRLYMTGLEIAWFRTLAGPPKPVTPQSIHALPVLDPKQDACPYQINGLCTVHPIRPFACRVFFCQPGSDDWQSRQYEMFQQKIKQLHDKLNLPYRYMEWRQGLADAQASGV